MKLMLVNCIFLGLLLTVKAQFGYNETNGPSTWPSLYPVCAESQQSPIAIVAANTVLNTSLGRFNREDFDSIPDSMLIRNNGHGVQIDLENGYAINDNRLFPGEYRAAQFHIHWARPGEQGSEHTLNGRQYWGELHIVHYNTKYSDLSAAVNESDGLAVIGFFLEDDYPQSNCAFDRFLSPIAENVIQFYRDNQTYSAAARFSLETLLPTNLDVYYRYQGSLTTPPCYESVLWTVFDTPLRISRNQANILETMVFENVRGESDTFQLYGNYRPPQPINSRVVTRSATSGSPKIQSSSLLIGLLLFALLRV